MGEAFGDKLHPRCGATGSQPRSLAAQLSTPRRRRRRRQWRQGPATLPENHDAQLSTVYPRSPLKSHLNFACGPVTSPRQKSGETGMWELCFLKSSKKTKQKSSSNIQPSRCNSPARCTLSPEPAGHSSPALRPHLGERGGHRRALTWHLLLSVQVVAVFTWVFK